MIRCQEDATEDDDAVPQPPILPLTAASIDRHGVYLMDAGTYIYVWVGAAIADQLCQDIFDKPNFHSLPEIMVSNNSH
jgi:protein transport protein SEC24